MTWEFQTTNFESLSGMIVRCCHEALDSGPIGDKLNPDQYRAVISCKTHPALYVGSKPADIGTVKTSCAVFAGAMLWWAGIPLKIRPGHSGWPMFGGWLGELNMRHSAWVPWTGKETPTPGSVFFVESPRNPNNCHVGVFIEDNGNNIWTTAEGGGGDGTECHIGGHRVLGSGFDHYGRKLMGWWDAVKLADHYNVGKYA